MSPVTWDAPRARPPAFTGVEVVETDTGEVVQRVTFPHPMTRWWAERLEAFLQLRVDLRVFYTRVVR